MMDPWVELNTDIRNYGFESKRLEAYAKKLYEHSINYPNDVNPNENPFGFIVNVAKNAKIPFIHIYHPREIAPDPSKYENPDPGDTPQTVNEMIDELNKKHLSEFWKEKEDPTNPMKLKPSGKNRIFIICRGYTLWTGNLLKLLRANSNEYPEFNNLQVRYRDGLTKGLQIYEKNRTETLGHHNWIEITLDGENWITFEPIYPGDNGHPPENYLTMDKVYKRYKLNLKLKQFIDTVQMYNQNVLRDILFLLNEPVPTRHYTDLIYVLKNGKKVFLEQSRPNKGEMNKRDIVRFESEDVRISSMHYGLPKEKEVFEEIEGDIIPLLTEPDIKELRKVRKRIKVVLHQPYGN